MIGKKLTSKRKKSINVCYLIDVLPERMTGGGQTHLLQLVKQMRKQKFKIPARDGAGKNQIYGGLGSSLIFRLAWTVYVIPQIVFHHFFREKFDLIHAHSVPAMVAGKLLSVILGIPIVVTVHGAWMRSPIERWVLTRVKYDVQITVSRDFLKHENVNKNVAYIPNGVDISRFQRSKSKIKSQKSKVLLFVGRKSDSVKGFEVLEKAMKEVKEKIPNVGLLVADGGLSQKKAIKMYHQANLFVLPSLSEGFPLTLLEAWAAKLPVVATAVGEVPFLLAGKEGRYRTFRDFVLGERGYLVKPGDSGSLARAIVEALKSGNLVEMGEAGYRIAKRYDWKKTARETSRIYKSVLNA